MLIVEYLGYQIPVTQLNRDTASLFQQSATPTPTSTNYADSWAFYAAQVCLAECHAHSNAHKPPKTATPTLTPTNRPKLATPTLTPTNHPKLWRPLLRPQTAQNCRSLTQRKFVSVECHAFLRSASLFQHSVTPSLTPTNRPKLWLLQDSCAAQVCFSRVPSTSLFQQCATPTLFLTQRKFVSAACHSPNRPKLWLLQFWR